LPGRLDARQRRRRGGSATSRRAQARRRHPFHRAQAGNGPRITKGDQLTGALRRPVLDGKIFNQNAVSTTAVHFRIGANPRQIVLGWERAILLMQAGGSYTIALPPAYAYADKGRTGQALRRTRR